MINEITDFYKFHSGEVITVVLQPKLRKHECILIEGDDIKLLVKKGTHTCILYRKNIQDIIFPNSQKEDIILRGEKDTKLFLVNYLKIKEQIVKLNQSLLLLDDSLKVILKKHDGKSLVITHQGFKVRFSLKEHKSYILKDDASDIVIRKVKPELIPLLIVKNNTINQMELSNLMQAGTVDADIMEHIYTEHVEENVTFEIINDDTKKE